MDFIMLVIMAAMIFTALLCSCRSSKYMRSEVRQHATLSEISERRTLSYLSDTIRKILSAGADSIILEFHSDVPLMPSESSPESPDKSALSASNLRLSAGNALTGDSSAKAAWYLGRLATAKQNKANNQKLKAIKIYAPHIEASHEEGGVGISSSSESNEKSELSDTEEDTVRKSAPFSTQSYLALLIIAAALALFVRWIYQAK